METPKTQDEINREIWDIPYPKVKIIRWLVAKLLAEGLLNGDSRG